VFDLIRKVLLFQKLVLKKHVTILEILKNTLDSKQLLTFEFRAFQMSLCMKIVVLFLSHLMFLILKELEYIQYI
jgi:hypothetical protein